MLVMSLSLGWPTKARLVSSRRGRSGREEVGGEGKGRRQGWIEGCRPRVQLKPTVTRPSLVKRLSEALHPWAQTERNSFTDAATNWELDLEAISTSR